MFDSNILIKILFLILFDSLQLVPLILLKYITQCNYKF